MSMFDYYEPDPPLHCPVCNAGVKEWQGKDGPNGLFVWRQGIRQPVGQLADEKLEESALATLHLANAFKIYAPCCSKQFFVEAVCRAPNGTWTSAELITAQNAHKEKDERMDHFKDRLRWLRRGRS